MSVKENEFAFPNTYNRLLQALEEIGVLSDLDVTEDSSPGMSIIITSGVGYFGGSYLEHTIPTTLNVDSADPSYPRKDIVVLNNSNVLSVIAGTPDEALPFGSIGVYTYSPQPPDIPANALILAEIWVGAGVTQILNTNITEKKVMIKKAGNVGFLVIAANDTANPGMADFICDGVDDEVEINTALSQAAVGTSVVLLEGNFVIGASINIPSAVTLRGQGLKTIITRSVAVNMISLNAITEASIRDMTLDGGNGAADILYCINCSYIIVERSKLKLNNASECTFTFFGDSLMKGNILSRCIIENPLGLWADLTEQDGLQIINNIITAISTGEGASVYTDCVRLIFQGNHFHGGANLNLASASSGHHIVTGNVFDTGQIRIGCDFCLVDGNIMGNCASNAIWIDDGAENNIISNNIIYDAGYDGIESNGKRNIIEGNQIYSCGRNGIDINADDHVITGNWIYYNLQHGIDINSDSNTIKGNRLTRNSELTYDTYDSIILRAGSTRNIVMGNWCGHATEYEPTRYGINEDASSADYNIIVGNICKGGVTGQIRTQGVNSEVEHNIET